MGDEISTLVQHISQVYFYSPRYKKELNFSYIGSLINKLSRMNAKMQYSSYCLDTSVLAVIHFNNNLKKDELVSQTGELQLKVVYPKFKNGEATVRSVRIQQNFGKWQNCLKCIVCVCSQTSMLEVKYEINVIVTYYL